MYQYSNKSLRGLGAYDQVQEILKETALAIVTPEIEDLSYKLSKGAIDGALSIKRDRDRIKSPAWIDKIVREEIAPGLDQTVSRVSQGVMKEILPPLILTALVTGVGFGWLQFKMLEAIKLRSTVR